MPEPVRRLLPRMTNDETPIEWGPVKVKGPFTQDHPFGRASGVFLLTTSQLWYVGTTTSVGLPLVEVATVSYSEVRRTGTVTLVLRTGTTYSFYESKRAMRRLAEALNVR